MRHYYVDTGHGIVCHGDFSARTAPLFSSALIAACNHPAGTAGIFHYPEQGLESESMCHQIERWIDCILPDELAIIFAPAHSHAALRAHECHSLTSWLVRRSHCALTVHSAVAAAIVIERGELRAGMVAEIGVPLEPVELIRVPSSTTHAGVEDCTVFGTNLSRHHAQVPRPRWVFS